MKHALIALRFLTRSKNGTLQTETITTSGWIEPHPDIVDHVVIWGNPNRTEKGLGIPATDLVSITPIPSNPYE